MLTLGPTRASPQRLADPTLPTTTSPTVRLIRARMPGPPTALAIAVSLPESGVDVQRGASGVDRQVEIEQHENASA
jgi:hypothetical protein